MKNFYPFLIICISLFLNACNSQKVDTKITIQQINDKVLAKDLKIDVNYANPMTGKPIFLSSGYDLIIRNDSALAYLPYYGRAYSAPIGSDGGIKFKELMKDFKAIPKKKDGEWTIQFKVDTPHYNYDVMVEIYSNGKSHLNFTCTQRQAISFSGELEISPSSSPL